MSGTFRRLSAAGVAALSVWRLEGDAADLCTLAGVAALPAQDRPIPVHAGGEDRFDEALLWVRNPGPPVVAELHLHGGVGIAAALREALATLGWLEGRDPRQSPEEALLARAQTPLELRVASALLNGAWERAVERVLDTDDPTARRRQLDRLESHRSLGQALDAVPRVAIVGPPNAGKSTLFNRWLAEERVVADPLPGTTRDAVEVEVVEDPITVRLVDTAGLGEFTDGIDRQAVDWAADEIACSWRTLWLFDASTPPPEPTLALFARARRPGDLLLLGRNDLPTAWSPSSLCGGPWVAGSALDGPIPWLAAIRQALFRPFGELPGAGEAVPLGLARREELAALRAEALPR